MINEPGPIRLALLKAEPWLLGGIIAFPLALWLARWVVSLFR